MEPDPMISRGSVDNALRLILMLQATGRLRVTDAARELGVAPSTAHRLLSLLCNRGFAEREPTRGYRAGPALTHSDRKPPLHDQIRAAIRPYLEQLSMRIGETIHLMVRDGTTVIFLDGIECSQILRVGLRTGRVLPAHCTSGGKALLAELSTAELAQLYPSGLPDWPSASIRDLPTLRRRLAVVRQQGYALNRGESEAGITAIGVSFRNAAGFAIAAVTAAAPETRGSSEWYLAAAEVLTAAAAHVAPAL